MNWLRVRELVRKEFIQLFRDRKNRPMLVIAPLIQVILFGYVVTTDVRDITVAVIDQSRTPDSRRLLDAFDGNPTFRVTRVLQDPKDLDRLLLQREVDIGLQIPPDFSARIRKGETAEVQVLVDGSMSNMAAVRIAYSVNVLDAFNTQLLRELNRRTHRLRRDRRPHPHLVQPQPGQPELLRAGDRRLPGHAALALVHLHGRRARERSRHHGAADRDPA